MHKIKQKKLFIFDLDGTIYLDGVLFPKVLELLEHIKKTNGKYLFLTNNSSRSRKDYVKRLNNIGIPCDLNNVATSAQATIAYVKANHLDGLFYVVGTESMINEMEEAGLAIAKKYQPEITGVIIGYDTELTYKKLEIATQLITEGKLYLATHPDLVCPVEFGSVPDCGAFAKMLEYATNRTPKVIGKPERLILDIILQENRFDPSEALVVGDRLNTDIACGQNAGIDTLLVLSGEAKLSDLKTSPVKPVFVLKSVTELYDILSDCV